MIISECCFQVNLQPLTECEYIAALIPHIKMYGSIFLVNVYDQNCPMEPLGKSRWLAARIGVSHSAVGVSQKCWCVHFGRFYKISEYKLGGIGRGNGPTKQGLKSSAEV